MRVDEALIRLRKALDVPDTDAQFEGLCAGDADAELHGMVVSFAPSLNVLRKAAASSRNLILSDAHPFYLYDIVWSTVASKPEPVLASPIAAVKRKLIEENKLAVVRLRTAWESKMPRVGPEALAAHLGWTHEAANSAAADFVVCSIPRTTLDALTEAIRNRAQLQGLRVVGTSNQPIARIAVANGMVSPAKIGRMLADPAVDAIVAGEVIEWEGGPYMEDVIASGRAAGLILIGYAASQEPLTPRVASWARSVLPNLPIDSMHDSDPIWCP